MKFSASLSVLALALSTRAAPSADATATTSLAPTTTTASAKAATTSYTRCEAGRGSEEYIEENLQPWVGQLYKPCVAGAASDGSDFWKRRACVAAAVAMGPRLIVDYATCDKASIPRQETLPYLDYGVYASIVGDCAYDSPACQITHQNLLDLVYGELSAAGATQWPADASEILADVIDPVFIWAHGDSGESQSTVAYSRFNQWLIHAGYLGTIIDDTHTDGKTYFYDHESDSI